MSMSNFLFVIFMTGMIFTGLGICLSATYFADGQSNLAASPSFGFFWSSANLSSIFGVQPQLTITPDFNSYTNNSFLIDFTMTVTANSTYFFAFFSPYVITGSFKTICYGSNTSNYWNYTNVGNIGSVVYTSYNSSVHYRGLNPVPSDSENLCNTFTFTNLIHSDDHGQYSLEFPFYEILPNGMISALDFAIPQNVNPQGVMNLTIARALLTINLPLNSANIVGDPSPYSIVPVGYFDDVPTNSTIVYYGVDKNQIISVDFTLLSSVNADSFYINFSTLFFAIGIPATLTSVIESRRNDRMERILQELKQLRPVQVNPLPEEEEDEPDYIG